MHDIFKLYDTLAKKQLTSLLNLRSCISDLAKRKYGRVLGRILNKSIYMCYTLPTCD